MARVELPLRPLLESIRSERMRIHDGGILVISRPDRVQAADQAFFAPPAG